MAIYDSFGFFPWLETNILGFLGVSNDLAAKCSSARLTWANMRRERESLQTVPETLAVSVCL